MTKAQSRDDVEVENWREGEMAGDDRMFVSRR
jgi:hypothetical protein